MTMANEQPRIQGVEGSDEDESVGDEGILDLSFIDSEEDPRPIEEVEAAVAAAATSDGDVESLIVGYDGTVRRTENELRRVRQLMGRIVNFVGNTDRRIRKIELDWINFDPFSGEYCPVLGDDVEALFRDVLPNHRTIERINIYCCTISGRCLSWFASSVPATRTAPLLELSVTGCDIEDGWMQFICSMLRRNVPLRKLHLDVPIIPVECQQVFEIVRGNRHLQSLAVRVHQSEILADTVELPVAPSSALRSLSITGTFAPEGSASLARQLRTNTTLTELFVNPGRDRRHGDVELLAQLEGTLRTYNFTLRSVRVAPVLFIGTLWEVLTALEDHVRRHLRRNERINQALQQLAGYNVSPTVRWPLVLEMVSGLPTLLYRFLRHGDSNALCDLLMDAAAGRSLSRPTLRHGKRKLSRATRP